MTTAEYVDGKFYLYYDEPNDENPHLIIDDDLTDGILGKEYGEVFNDPSHGSDAGVFRDEDGTFHMIYEDWRGITDDRYQTFVNKVMSRSQILNSMARFQI